MHRTEMAVAPRALARRLTQRAGIAAVCVAGVVLTAHAQVEISDPGPEFTFGKTPLYLDPLTLSDDHVRYFSVSNRGSTAVTLGKVTVEPQAVCVRAPCPVAAVEDFLVRANSDGCSGRTLKGGEGCSTLLGFVPTLAGPRSAQIVFPVEGGIALKQVVSGIGVINPTDCVLDWAERTYPTVLMQPTDTLTVEPYVGRCYQAGAFCLAADLTSPTRLPFVAPNMYLYNPTSNPTVQLLGSLANLAAMAACK